MSTRKAPALGELFQHAAALLHQGNLAAAGPCFRTILQRDPRHAPSLQLLGIIRAREGRLDEAIALLRKALLLEPNSAEAHNNLGMALHAAGQSTPAVAHYEQALAINPRYAVAHNNLGIARAALDRPEDAIVQYGRALVLDPRYVEALSNLGNALARLGRRNEAVEALQKALAIRPDFVEARTNLGIVLSALDRHQDAIVEFRHALSVQPKNPRLHLNIGNALHALNRHDEAITHYREALALDPGSALAASKLGLALEEIGRIEDARIAYEKAIALEPRRPSHYHSLTKIRKTASGDPHLARMEVLARGMRSLAAPDQIELHFALGKALADAGEDERAFGHFFEGNALKRRELRYDEATVLGRLDRTRKIFTPELMRSKHGTGDPSRLPIFIVGMPRSGSTLVEQILASHPAVLAGGEINDFREASRELGAQTGAEPFPENVPGMTAEQLRGLAENYLGRITKIAAAGSSSRPQRITDKLPANFRYAGLIHLALPNARIIHTCRDPIDTCLSCFSILFVTQPFTYDLGELGRYYRTYARLMDHWREMLPSSVLLDVKYEELVADFEAQARRIVTHCGLEWDDRCLAFYDARRPVRTASLVQVRQPVYQTSIGRWRPSDDVLRPLLHEIALAPSAALGR